MQLTLDEAESGESESLPGAEPGPDRFRYRFHNKPDAPTREAVRASEWDRKRSIQSIVAEEGKLPSHHAIRILLGVREVLQSGTSGHCRDLSMESVMVDRDGKITMANDNREERSRWETTDVQALGGLFYGMLTGKPPGRLAAGEESAASLSPRLRTILERSLSRDPRNRYATVEDFFRDVEREERVQFYQTLLIPLVLVGLLTLLYLLQNNH